MENIFITKDNIETILSLLKDHLDENQIKINTGGTSGNIGEIFFWSISEPPDDALFCDGSEISREEYRDLFNVIGTIYGNGDGETTFNLPDLRGQFIRGFDPLATRDPQGTTRGFGSSQAATEIPNFHAFRAAGNQITHHFLRYPNPGRSTGAAENNTTLQVRDNDGHSGLHTGGRIEINVNAVSTINPIRGHFVRPTNINLLPCIRYKSNSKDLENRIKELEKIIYES